ncbi:MAG: thiamine-phosphate kinase [Acidobacteriaceae bacterium]|nr:thiamine-phosphate kinase [Acidobacteriaceae bacterium]MBV8568994.1 thiamine-phosphate kinase [Acidobacteriaceae bacterium]
MREIQLVARIRKLAQTSSPQPSIIKGIGDDCAVMRPRAAEDLVFTTDFVLEGRHFTLDTHSPGDIGHKALARSLSDLAAMGAEPVFCLVSLAFPGQLAGAWVNNFYKALVALATRFNMTLAGGDLSRFEKVVADVICCGRVPRGKALLRNGAKPKDGIFVTGELGGSAHGLAAKRGPAWRRHLRPEPRVAAGLALRTLGVSAAMDLSDGLSLDLHRLCLESNVSATIDSAIPISHGATLEQALHGGEDYELLFTASPRKRVPSKIGDLPVTQIGVIRHADRPGTVLFQGRRLHSGGFDHFA